MPILSQMFKEWSIIIFVMISAGLTYIVFPFYDIAHASLPTLRMARRLSRSFSAERSLAAPSGNS